jgi:hypothetical protein
MPNIGAAAQADKLSNETWWAVTGRAVADAAMQGQPLTMLFIQARERRQLEYEQVATETRFASLLRQLADAYSNCRDTKQFVQQLVSLRSKEIGPALTDDQRLDLRER